jgi:hypothetical protein
MADLWLTGRSGITICYEWRPWRNVFRVIIYRQHHTLAVNRLDVADYYGQDSLQPVFLNQTGYH